jgi:hypothetical protein
MAIANLSSQYISSSFQNLMQISSSNAVYNGAGTQVTTLLVSASYATTSSYALNAATGSQGAIGAQGVQGRQGTIGSQGAVGSQGQIGATGIGTIGAQGTIGSQGAEGIQGAQGEIGFGLPGAQGAVGIQGATGTGIQGVQGTSGAGGSPGGSDFDVQYNNAGSFGGTNLLIISGSGVFNTAAVYNKAQFVINSTDATGDSYGTRTQISAIAGTVYNFTGTDLKILDGNIMELAPIGVGASFNIGDVIQFVATSGEWEAITNASDTKLAEGSIGVVVESTGFGSNVKVLFDGLIVVRAHGSYWGGFNTGTVPSWTIYPRDTTGGGSTALGRARPSTGGYILRALGTILADTLDTPGDHWLTVQWRPELKGTVIKNYYYQS